MGQAFLAVMDLYVRQHNIFIHCFVKMAFGEKVAAPWNLPDIVAQGALAGDIPRF